MRRLSLTGLLLFLTLLATTPARAQVPDATGTGTLTAAAASPAACVYAPADSPSCIKLTYEGYSGVGALLGGVFAATVVAEISPDGGTTWTMVNLLTIGTGIFANAAQPFVATSGLYAFAALGGGNVAQIRVSAFGSGRVHVTLRATTAFK